MGDALHGAGKAESAEEDRLKETARQVSLSALSRTLVVAAQAVVAAVSGDSGGGLGEPGKDLRRLRTDGRLMPVLDRDVRVAMEQVRLLVSDALWVGFLRAAKTRRPPGVVGEPDDSDRAALEGYPILGMTASEVAASLSARLLEDVNRALALPLTGKIDPATIPAALGGVANTHADRVSGAVGEGYRAGVQAAVRAFGKVLAGV